MPFNPEVLSEKTPIGYGNVLVTAQQYRILDYNDPEVAAWLNQLLVKTDDPQLQALNVPLWNCLLAKEAEAIKPYEEDYLKSQIELQEHLAALQKGVACTTENLESTLAALGVGDEDGDENEDDDEDGDDDEEVDSKAKAKLADLAAGFEMTRYFTQAQISQEKIRSLAQPFNNLLALLMFQRIDPEFSAEDLAMMPPAIIDAMSQIGRTEREQKSLGNSKPKSKKKSKKTKAKKGIAAARTM